MSALSTRILLIVCTCAFAPFATSYGQKTTKKLKVYVASVTSLEGLRMKGILEEVRDSSVIILTANQRIKIPGSTIRDIKIKRKGAVGRGALSGGLSGLALGMIIGFASGDDECPQGSWFCMPVTAEEKALGLGTVLGLGGAVTGIIIGSVSKAEKISINGNQGIFEENLEVMKKYAIQNSLR